VKEKRLSARTESEVELWLLERAEHLAKATVGASYGMRVTMVRIALREAFIFWGEHVLREQKATQREAK